MLTLRRGQIAAVSVVSSKPFHERIARHVRRFFGPQCQDLDDEALLQLILDIVLRAYGYGIVSERDVCKFVNLQLLLGPSFEDMSSWAWTREYLEAARDGQPTLQINRLYRAVQRELEASR